MYIFAEIPSFPYDFLPLHHPLAFPAFASDPAGRAAQNRLIEVTLDYNVLPTPSTTTVGGA